MKTEHYIIIGFFLLLSGAAAFLYMKKKKQSIGIKNTETSGKQNIKQQCFLCKGSQGKKVEELQYLMKLKIDGIWGGDTQRQVEKMLGIKSFKTEADYKTAITALKHYKI